MRERVLALRDARRGDARELQADSGQGWPSVHHRKLSADRMSAEGRGCASTDLRASELSAVALQGQRCRGCVTLLLLKVSPTPDA